MIVNLNVMCKVQLNDFGKNIWLSQINEIPEEVRTKHPEVIDNIRKQIDENDCIELELWAIINIYGRYINNTKSPFRSNTIELNKNPDFGNYFKKENE